MIPALEHVADFTVELSPPHELGEGPNGVQRIIPIVGGTVSGPRLAGRILEVGADWQTIAANGVAQLDARYALETEDGAVIEIASHGIRDVSPEVAARIAAGEPVPPSSYYMRTAIRLTTGHPAYDWVNRVLFVAAGGKVGNTVRLAVYRVG
ncbi:MAG: DUF3237 domain-containing protein [Sphingomonadales bacterium]|nr:DUF3237 domain-containing protein [Sphingomonadales bacterium]